MAEVTKRTICPLDWVGDVNQFKPGWWVRDERVPDVLYLGPYDTKAEAEDCKRGQDRFWRGYGGK